jgi:hypothetical protein
VSIEENIPAILLCIGSIGSGIYLNLPRAHMLPWMMNPLVAAGAGVGGTIASFYSLYLFIHSMGWGAGFLWWLGIGMATVFVVRQLMFMYPGVLMLSFVLMVVGLFKSF